MENPPALAAMTDLAILIPAAGAASRMRGADKLLMPVQGMPLLRRQVIIALPLAPVIVTLRDPDPARRAALDGLPVSLEPVPDAATGMSASFRAVALMDTALLILPADMPDLSTADLAAMIAAFRASPDQILRASSGSTPGHPVIWPRALVPGFAALTGDRGARTLLQQQPVQLFPLPGQNALTDLDTPEDWAAWAARQTASNTRTS
jgi:molybdenum cofactor cytidylyltransferase